MPIATNTYRYHGYTDPRSSSGEGVQGRISENSQSWTRKSTNQKFLINKTFGDKHKLNGLIAYEYRDYTYNWIEGVGTGFIPGFQILLRNRPARNCRRLHQPGGSQLLLHQVELHVRQQVPPSTHRSAATAPPTSASAGATSGVSAPVG